MKKVVLLSMLALCFSAFTLSSCGGKGSSEEAGSASETKTISFDKSTLTDADLQKINEKIKAEIPFEKWKTTTYADILKYTGGIEAEVIKGANGNYEKHRWGATDNETSNFFVSFKDSEELVGISGMGYSII